MKTTAIAPSNLAFTKYWGKKDELLRLPENGSISMCLSGLLTTTTVEFSKNFAADKIIINDTAEPGEVSRVSRHLDRVRNLAGISDFAWVVSQNNFPTATGLSSSASGFAALSLAASRAAGLELSEKELSILARQGSGSACRSVPSGFVEWLNGEVSETSYARTIFPPDYWNIADVAAIANSGRKDLGTTEGMKTLGSSPYAQLRISSMEAKNARMRKLIEQKDFSAFGELIEAEALDMHAIMMTQSPPLIYLQPHTILIMKLVWQWRTDGLECYFTINTGQDVHILVEQKNVDAVVDKLTKIPEVKKYIVNVPAQGVRLSNGHLF